MTMMRSEAFKKRVAKTLRNPPGGHIPAEITADFLRLLPVAPKDRAAKKALIRELLNIEKQVCDSFRRTRAVADAIERLSVDQALMPRPTA